MPKSEFICQTCGKTGLQFPSRPRRFCSRSCFFDSRSRGGVIMKPKTGRWDPCRVCESPIWRLPSDVAHNRRWMCSRRCVAELLKTSEWIERSCAQCGTSMGLRRVTDRRRSCSKQCATELRTVNAIDRTHNGVRARRNTDGYVLVWEPNHPKATAGWVYEHRLVAEQMIGRPLVAEEIVHHINRIKDDNCQSNLAVVNSKTHARLTANERMADRALFDEYIRRFGPIDFDPS